MGKRLKTALILIVCMMVFISGGGIGPVHAEDVPAAEVNSLVPEDAASPAADMEASVEEEEVPVPEPIHYSVYLNGFLVEMGIEPEFYDDILMVPLKDIAQAMEAAIAWNPDTEEITMEREGITLMMPLGGSYAQVNGQEVQMDAGPVLMHSIIAVPVQFVGETFGYEVTLDETEHRVDIDLPARSMRVVTYFIPGDEQSISWSSLSGLEGADPEQVPPDLVSDLALGWYSINWDGSLLRKSATGWWRPEGWEQVLDTAQELQLNTEMVIYASNYDDKISKLLANPQAVRKAVTQIAKEAQLYGGVNLDLEELGYNQNPAELKKTRSQFNDFINKLSRQLQEEGKTLTLTLHPPNSIYQGYDYEYLGEKADRIIVMAYDYGILPEPNDMVGQALEMAVQQVPAEKLLLGISKQNETRFSIKAKLELARRYQVEGIALWYWGSLDTITWDMLESRILSRSAEGA